MTLIIKQSISMLKLYRFLPVSMIFRLDYGTVLMVSFILLTLKLFNILFIYH
jgi:hypothetical protein